MRDSKKDSIKREMREMRATRPVDMVTTEQIEAARTQVLKGERIVHLGGHTILSIADLEHVLQNLASAGRIAPTTEDATTGAGELIGTYSAPELATVDLSHLSEEEWGRFVHFMQSQPEPTILPDRSGMEWWTTVVEEGEPGTEQEGMVREVRYGPWQPVVALLDESVGESVEEATPQLSKAPTESPKSSESFITQTDVADQQGDKESDKETDKETDPEPDSDIPANFPGRAQLIAAGYLTIEAIRAIPLADMTTINGIKQATAGKIFDALAKLAESAQS